MVLMVYSSVDKAEEEREELEHGARESGAK
jgi:hypothetical protein